MSFLKFAPSFSNCATVNWIIWPFPALSLGSSSWQGESKAMQMFGSMAGVVLGPAGSHHTSWDILNAALGLTSPVSWDWSFQTSLEVQRGQFPDWRVIYRWLISQVPKISDSPKSSSQKMCKNRPISTKQLWMTCISLFSAGTWSKGKGSLYF